MKRLKIATLEDIFVGRTIKVVSEQHGNDLYRIVSMPYKEKFTGSIFVDVEYLDYDWTHIDGISLRDAGILPNNYNDRVTYVVV